MLRLAIAVGGLALLAHDTSGVRMWLGLSAVFLAFSVVGAPWGNPVARRPLAVLTITLVGAAALLTDWRGPGWHVGEGRGVLAFVALGVGTSLFFRLTRTT